MTDLDGGRAQAVARGEHLRVLIANEKPARLAILAQILTGLGHAVVAQETVVARVAADSAREHPDVALVGLGESTEHALDLISGIAEGSSCPVIAILNHDNPEYVRAAARRGVFAYVVDGTAEELQSAIEITLQRFSQYQTLRQGADHQALVAQATGILMANHGISATQASEMLRDRSDRDDGHEAGSAESVIKEHLMLVPAATSHGLPG
jgi:AmiR/NasT family two-component response regulator